MADDATLAGVDPRSPEALESHELMADTETLAGPVPRRRGDEPIARGASSAATS